MAIEKVKMKLLNRTIRRRNTASARERILSAMSFDEYKPSLEIIKSANVSIGYFWERISDLESEGIVEVGS